MRFRQLFLRAPAGTQLFVSMQRDGTARTSPADGLPLPIWPDGRWCAEVALYLGKAVRRNLSLFSRGGTVATYTSQISHLVRYCWRKNCPFDAMDDDEFTKFMGGMKDELLFKNDEPKDSRNSNTVISIGRRCLEFLEFVGNLHGITGLLSGEEGHIKAERRAMAVGSSHAARKRIVHYWYHHSFPERVEDNKRHLIGIDYVTRLRRAAITYKSAKMGRSDPFIKQRRLVLLRLLEATGGRRCEIALITVEDIQEALASVGPFLKLYSAKRTGNNKSNEPHRFVKVTYNDLDYIQRYIDKFRAPLIDRLLGSESDHGFLLVGVDHAERMVETTITGELRRLRIEAKITGKAHPHLFRHRFITIRLKDLIEAHKLSNRTEFEILFQMEGFKKEVAESTGHKSLASLDRYIDWAFIELAGSEGNERKFVDMARVAASVESSLAEIEALRESLSPEQFTLELMHRYEALAQDVGARVGPKKRTAGNQTLHDATQ
ncbi:site-specific tyrosine recombinase XerD [Caballeronia udeis]|uniref:Site-specific tyrosine recombinase XerD n=2 Tax=Caballeronia udeis TaxID=1232866 RepID=A0A158IYC1_9BURK|nr:site-specific tyrosine recombinase XerD [Caballeronia udeis]